MSDIDAYIDAAAPDVRGRLVEMRALAHEVAPDAQEAISYGMPTFKIGGRNAFHFAAHRHHIGFYPTPHAMEQFATELAGYATSHGAVRFPHDQPLPLDLIRRMMTDRRDHLA